MIQSLSAMTGSPKIGEIFGSLLTTEPHVCQYLIVSCARTCIWPYFGIERSGLTSGRNDIVAGTARLVVPNPKEHLKVEDLFIT
jgi:hypothetical protein